MQLNLNPAAAYNFRYTATIPAGFDGAVLRGASVLTAIDPQVGQIVQQEISNAHYTIRLYLFRFLQPLQLSVFQPAAILCSILAVKNRLEYRIEGMEDLQLRQGQFALLHTGGKPAILNFSNTHTHEFMEISYKTEWLKRLLTQFDFLRKLFNVPAGNQSFFLGAHPKPAGSMALDKVKQILQSPFDDSTSRLLFESHTWEYLVLILIESAKSSSAQMRLTEREREILDIIREEGSTNHRRKYTIGELCHRANMSATKFKTAIKQTLGMTFGQHRMKARMDAAHDMLLEGKLSIKQVAEKVNYKNPNSFAKQFKKHFKYLPTEVRRRN